MNTLEFSLLVFLGSLGAGFLGSLTGLGGGVVIVPLLTLAFGVDIRYAIGASLVSVIATSSGAAAADQRVEAIVGALLRTGVLIAAAVALVGGVGYLARYGATPADYRVFRGEPSDLRSVAGIVRDVLALRSRGVIQLGLLPLIATPVARVAFAGFAFARQGDRTYIVITLLVLAVLVYSLASPHP